MWIHHHPPPEVPVKRKTFSATGGSASEIAMPITKG
jgi:hypothetical protein